MQTQSNAVNYRDKASTNMKQKKPSIKIGKLSEHEDAGDPLSKRNMTPLNLKHSSHSINNQLTPGGRLSLGGTPMRNS